jgi:ABC-type dipeptide/oligopeptide/nickel transport system permease subunit
MMLRPVLALIRSVHSLNLVGDALRDKFDPHNADRGIGSR